MAMAVVGLFAIQKTLAHGHSKPMTVADNRPPFSIIGKYLRLWMFRLLPRELCLKRNIGDVSLHPALTS